MAARLLLQRHAASVATAVVAGGIILKPSQALAEGPSRQARKPIYDDYELPETKTVVFATPAAQPVEKQPVAAAPQPDAPTTPRGPTPTDRLAVQIGKARLFVYEYALAAENAVNRTMDRAFDLEHSFTSTVASLAPARESGEKLMPGAVYVLVAAMAGSIVTRRSNIVFRATAPLALGLTAGWTLLPVTMRNVSDLAWKYEQRFPVVADSHLRIREGIEQSISFAKVHREVGARYVDEVVTDTRETIEGWVKKAK
ncbi:apolipo protein O-domain-containing protein [Plectosphaerella cucumerina]|uniref:MICOS complex subunit n=1 Tax=Plectosphaerella cucumerina TaxID=40658 RepID=A0A8K0TNX7_9PEZI|nr:apolipo protein O-domain-containing protein [Plectosphaerella cucumerina]